MKPSALNKILADLPEGLPREQLEAYLAGTLSPGEQHAVEEYLNSGGLSDEAMEGFEAHPAALASLGALQADVQKLTGTQQAWWQSSWAKSLGALAGGALLVTLGYNLAPESTALPEPEPIVQPAMPVEEEPVPTENFLEVVEATPEQAAEVVTETTPDNTPEVAPEVETPEVATAPAPEPTPEPSPPVERMELKPDPDPEPASRAAAEAVTWMYMDGFKVYDYSEEYDNDVEEKVPAYEGGIPAQFENERTMRSAESDWRTVTHQYEDVLELGIAHLDAKKYRKALDKFKLILTTFPEDQNALFYSGFCYHKQRKYIKAIAAFDQVLESENKTFHEEALWYQALSYQYDGDWATGKSLMEQVEQAGGFYAEKAREYLRKPKK